MKHGTIRHPKLLALATALELRPFEALGLLEALLDWTYDFAARGDVGRFSDADIAHGIGYPGDPARLIGALVATHWLDPCVTARLVVHKLAEHAPWSWQRTLERRHVDFASPVPPETPQGVFGAPAAPTPTPTPDLSFALLTQGDATSPRPTELGFETFWKPYPKKRHKPAALRAWKAVDGARHLEVILAGVERWQASEQWQGGRIEDPSTFLRQRQWEDAVPATVTSNSVEGMADRIRKKGLL
jgi:hypothetical protein